ncbi:MAG: von Willebrand factor type A domain-containing protein [Kiritimatiellae bacterium]|nr:von Willebrand factor type A domain-containing protein [Kiritimatiellia bacterium]
MNTCACEERLTSWLLGGLPQAEAEAMRLHLADCAACRARAAELEPVVAALRAGLSAAPDKPLRLYPAKRRRVLSTQYGSPVRQWWAARHTSLLATAAVLVVLVLLMSAFYQDMHVRATRKAAPTQVLCSPSCEVVALEADATSEEHPADWRDKSDSSHLHDYKLESPKISSASLREDERLTVVNGAACNLPASAPEAKDQGGINAESLDTIKIKQNVSAMHFRDLSATHGTGKRRLGIAPESKMDPDVKVEVALPDSYARPEAAGGAERRETVGANDLGWEYAPVAAASRPSAPLPPAKAPVEAGKAAEPGVAASGVASKEEMLRRVQPADKPSEDAPPPPTQRPPAAHNSFIETRVNPFSTFAIDVDTAAYTLTRQALTGGALPDPESVRTEEIVNAFDYGDSAPDNATFRVYVEGAPSPFGAGLTLLRVGVKGRRLGREEQRPAMLTFLVDTSGSMDQPDRIGLARQALALLLERLAPQDRLQLITFDDHARLILETSPGMEGDRILAAFDRLRCRGSTNLEEGMRQAYEQAARGFVPGAENRVILISDGVANLGTDSAADILTHIEAYRRQGITCTVFGVGRGVYNDRMLEELANRGDGSYRYLDSPEEVRRAFVDDLAATLNTIATDVKIQVEWNPAAISRYRQLGYENRALTKEQFRDDTVDAGEVGSGQSVTALYELELPSAQPADRPLGMVRVRYRRVDTQAIEEIEQPIMPRQIAPRIEAARPELRLAASAAEFAELLRRSPHAAGGRFGDVARLLHPVALEMKLDTRVAELLRLTELADGISK